MAASSRAMLRVEYVDGETVDFNPNRPALLLAMERKYGVQSPDKHEHVFWLAHSAVANGERFAEWLDRVESVEPVGPVDGVGDETPGK